ncbi:MAG: hypothetical protein JKY54_04755 [Flavobacteriales bacterium]|nr:hypothetical protein [Flavobacteriales bacterium]
MMKSTTIILRLGIVTATIALSGCAVSMSKVGKYDGLSQINADEATVYVYRERAITSSANDYDVLIDNNLVGALPNGSYLKVSSASGSKMVKAGTGMGRGSEVDFENGKLYCMKLSYNFNILMKSADIDPVSLATCNIEMTDLDYVMLKSEAKALGLTKKTPALFE